MVRAAEPEAHFKGMPEKLKIWKIYVYVQCTSKESKLTHFYYKAHLSREKSDHLISNFKTSPTSIQFLFAQIFS